MEASWYLIVFVFGTIIGSFLNVVLYRLHTGKSLNGRSHCMSCGKTLQWYELFPVISYVIQRGKCRGCHAHVPSRYLIVEMLTGLSYLLIWHLFSEDLITFFLYVALVSVSIVIIVYDMRHTIIPDELSALLGVIAVGFLGYAYFITRDILAVSMDLLAGIYAFTFFGGLWYISKGRWIGFGDAKLAVPLGIMVGIGGVFSMIVLSFWIGAILSLLLLGMGRLLGRGKTRLRFLPPALTIKSEVPFAPFLMLGFFLVELFHADIFDITYALLFQ